ncbi:MAG: hypothetical protein ACRD4L_05490 [Pyrinomonadaceae bacterium]
MATESYKNEQKNAIWRCEECGCYHLRVDGVMLTLTMDEFVEMANKIVETYAGEYVRGMINQPAGPKTAESTLYEPEISAIELISEIEN